jgi:uncharacterized protein (TIGR03435 family)
MRAALALLLLFAQATPTFDVVSIKPTDPKTDPPFYGSKVEGNRWLASSVTLRTIIRVAHGSEGFDMPDRVVGGPAWLDKDPFDIVAAGTAGATRAQREKMLQAMLADRFQLTAHVEKKTVAAYELVLARRDRALGSTLQRTTTVCNPECSVGIMYGPSERMSSESVAMARFAFVLSTNALRRPVIDRAGLAGQFTFSLEFAPGTEITAAAAPDAPSIFTAIEEQLGLKLRPVKTSLDVLVIDRAEKPAFD